MRKIILLISFFLIGCNSLPINEIRIGGGYKDIEGEIVIGLDQERSDNENATVITENGKPLYTFDEQQLEELKGKIVPEPEIEALVVKSTYQQIIEELDNE